jgi:hypothetical protein
MATSRRGEGARIEVNCGFEVEIWVWKVSHAPKEPGGVGVSKCRTRRIAERMFRRPLIGDRKIQVQLRYKYSEICS